MPEPHSATVMLQWLLDRLANGDITARDASVINLVNDIASLPEQQAEANW